MELTSRHPFQQSSWWLQQSHQTRKRCSIPRKQLYQGAGTKDVQRDMDVHHDKSCFRILFVRSAGDLGDVILIQEKDQGFEVTARGS
jgi:hypothetical protein